MPTIYIKAVEDSECKITNFKDVTVVIDRKQRICYISFNIMNIGEATINSLKIILPFRHEHISQLKANTIGCHSTQVYNNFTQLLYQMENSLEQGDSFFVKIGFKITNPKPEEKIKLHYFNLSPIEDSINNDITRYPSICTKTMKLYVALPKSFIKDNMSVSAECYKSEDISSLISEIQYFFDEDKILNEKMNEIFEWTNKQLADLEEELHPEFSKRLVRFEVRKKDSVQIRGYNCSYGTILSILISIVALSYAIIKSL